MERNIVDSFPYFLMALRAVVELRTFVMLTYLSWKIRNRQSLPNWSYPFILT
jgi:hypothetical protein